MVLQKHCNGQEHREKQNKAFPLESKVKNTGSTQHLQRKLNLHSSA